MIFPFFLVLQLEESTPINPPEICANGIDDDGDGLIDQNDEDCFCPVIGPVSLIPNPSFEDQRCCPTTRSEMNCATTWIQASTPTTDYIHLCGWRGWEGLPIPLPIPDGEGAIGFRDGRFSRTDMSNSNPNWKEYAGACLISPLRAGVDYKFQFHIGFTNQINSPAINITFFGTTDCRNLPFGENDENFGCPTNGPGWTLLGSTFASGSSEWKQVEINVRPREDITAIAIGPACAERSLDDNPYYFFDNLILAEQSAFEFEIVANNQPCAPDLSLSLPEYDTLTYQWYKDGIALVGETERTLSALSGEGNYQVVLDNGNECGITKAFVHRLPVINTVTAQTICQGESYLFGAQQLTEAGIYWDTLKATSNCDSIVQLELEVERNVESTVDVKIFPFESFNIGQNRFNQPGEFSRTIPSSLGCDSTVNLTLDYYHVYIPNIFSPNGDGINDFFNINGDTDLQQIVSLRIFNRWGGMIYEANNLTPNLLNSGWNGQSRGEDVPEAVYVYTTDIVMDDGKKRTLSGMVTVMR